MAAYYAAYRIIHKRRRRNDISHRILKDLKNPFNLDEDVFKRKFSLNQKGVQYLVDLLSPIMKRNQGYPVELQILASLQVLTSGSFQNRVGEDQILCVSQATISRSLDAFLEAILEIEPTVIEFPSISEFAFTEPKFYGQSKIPNIIGVLDCIHILINKPHIDDYTIYLNAKKEFSINVLLICDSNQYILDAAVHWPGSSSNSLIWKNSSLRNVLKDNTMLSQSYLLGDNTFPLEPWLLVPYEDCQKSEELIFNDHVYRALSVIQMCLGTLTSRFKCIHHKSGPLHYSPEKCSKIITACIVLHNICIKMGIDLNESEDLDDDVFHMPYADTDSDMEETMLMNEAMRIRDDVARQLIS